MDRRFWLLGLVVAALALGGAAAARACSTPVFRVALLDKRWRPKPYELYLFHKGPLNEQDRAVLKGLNDTLDRHEDHLNARLEVVDLDNNRDEDLLELWQAQGQAALPYLVVRYP